MPVFGPHDRGFAADPRLKHSCAVCCWRLGSDGRVSIVWRSASLEDPSLAVDVQVTPPADPRADRAIEWASSSSAPGLAGRRCSTDQAGSTLERTYGVRHLWAIP